MKKEMIATEKAPKAIGLKKVTVTHKAKMKPMHLLSKKCCI